MSTEISQKDDQALASISAKYRSLERETIELMLETEDNQSKAKSMKKENAVLRKQINLMLGKFKAEAELADLNESSDGDSLDMDEDYSEGEAFTVPNEYKKENQRRNRVNDDDKRGDRKGWSSVSRSGKKSASSASTSGPSGKSSIPNGNSNGSFKEKTLQNTIDREKSSLKELETLKVEESQKSSKDNNKSVSNSNKRRKIIKEETKTPTSNKSRVKETKKTIKYDKLPANKRVTSEWLQEVPEPKRKVFIEQCLGQARQVVQQTRNNRNAWAFAEPVDPVELGIPDYPNIVKCPMDLGTILDRLKGDYYSSADMITQVVEDVRLVFKNAVEYNEPNNAVYQCAIKVSNFFEKKLTSSLKIPALLPVGWGPSTRWVEPLGWRRVEMEETLVGGKRDEAFCENPRASLGREKIRLLILSAGLKELPDTSSEAMES